MGLASVHNTAIIVNRSLSDFGDDVIVHPYAIIGRVPDRSAALARQPEQLRGVVIGRGTIIGCHAVIYGDVEIGEDCLIGDYASVREGSRIGNKCVIGRQVTINYNAVIGDQCRFQDGTHITGNCVIGDECFFGVGVVTSNDRTVDLDEYHFPNPPQPCVFGKKVLVGSGANVLAGAMVGDGAVIGAGAVVTKNVAAYTTVLGKAAEVYVRRKSDAELLLELTK